MSITYVVYYDDGGQKIEIARVTANHSMSIDDVLNHHEVDLDKFAEEHGIENFDFDYVQLEVE